MTTKIETREARKCVECYMESIYRLISGYRTTRHWVPGLSAEKAVEVKAEALKQIAAWGDDAKAETRKHRHHAGRNQS